MSAAESFALRFSLFEAAKAGSDVRIDANRAATPTVKVVSILRDQLKRAVAIAAKLSTDATVHLQDAASTYRVLTGDNAGEVRCLATVIIGFVPRSDVSISRWTKQAARSAAFCARNRSRLSLAAGRKIPPGAPVVVETTLDPGRFAAHKTALVDVSYPRK